MKDLSPNHKNNQEDNEGKVVDDRIDLMANSMQKKLGKRFKVKIRRSRVETAVHIAIKGTLDETEQQIQNIYKSLTGEDFLQKAD
jgi:hypothetical protein